MRKKITRHHIIPKSIGGSNHRNNIIELMNTQHRALHTIFENQDPVEQIDTILSISATALTEEFKRDIIKILSIQEIQYFYNLKCIK